MALQHVMDSLPSIYPTQQAELFTKAYILCDSVKTRAASIDVHQVALEAKAWVFEHPYQTGFYVASGVIIVVPGLVAAPALGAAGFTTEGVAGGSAAAAFQSTAGPIVAHSVFATLQSAAAAAAGSGGAIVHGAIQGVVVAGHALKLGASALLNKRPKLEAGEGSSEVDDQEEKEAEKKVLKAEL